MHVLMSAMVLAAGLLVALVLDASAEQRLFGWVLVAIGALGVAGSLLMRRGGPRPPA